MTMRDTVASSGTDEQEILDLWAEAGLFQAPEAGLEDDVEGVILPPPSPNGRLHVGHALNLALQEAYTRQRRMAGTKVLWPALIDHGGSSTQYAVETQLVAQGLDPATMSREQLAGHVERVNDENVAAILGQMQRFGSLMDFSERRFLGDAKRSEQIASIFVELHERDMLYRDEAIVNWCPRCQSALSELDVRTETTFAEHYRIKFRVEDDPDRWLEARSRSVETLMGDPALVVHPDDPRYADLVGKNVSHPLTGEPIPVVTGRHVDPDCGPGVARHTPAMCQTDYELARTASLPVVPVYAADGRIRWEGGRLLSLDEARTEALDRLEARDDVVTEEPQPIQISVCTRCGTEVQPGLSRQWFLRRAPFIPYGRQVLADGELELRPPVYEERYLSWLEQLEKDSVEREEWWESCCVSFERGISGSQDWCISRQIAWGNPIPAWVCDGCGGQVVSLDALDTEAVPPACPSCSEPMHAERDVLDMAFSCALYAIVAMRTLTSDEALLEHIQRHTVALTGSDLVYFWIPFAAMMGTFTRGYAPFRKVWLHSLVTDGEGRKMSKSVGNVLTFDEAVERVGAEGLRYALLSAFDLDQPNLHVDTALLDRGQAERREVAEALAEAGRRFEANGVGSGEDVSTLAAAVGTAIGDLDTAGAIARLRESAPAAAAFRETLALWHPFLPFTTEALFQRHFPGEGVLAAQPWPGAR